MSNREKVVAESLVEALAMLPEDKREYLIGYAEGVAAMASKCKPADREGK